MHSTMPPKKAFASFIMTIVATSAGLAAGMSHAQDTPPAKLGLCASCHGKTGISNNPMYPNLAGQKEGYLKKQLADFKSGKRSDPTMGGLSKTLSDDEINQLAAYFAKQAACK